MPHSGAGIRDDISNKHAQVPPFHWTCLQLQGNSEGLKIQINYCYRHFRPNTDILDLQTSLFSIPISNSEQFESFFIILEY